MGTKSCFDNFREPNITRVKYCHVIPELSRNRVKDLQMILVCFFKIYDGFWSTKKMPSLLLHVNQNLLCQVDVWIFFCFIRPKVTIFDNSKTLKPKTSSYMSAITGQNIMGFDPKL